jgi:hypothetical protein
MHRATMLQTSRRSALCRNGKKGRAATMMFGAAMILIVVATNIESAACGKPSRYRHDKHMFHKPMLRPGPNIADHG